MNYKLVSDAPRKTKNATSLLGSILQLKCDKCNDRKSISQHEAINSESRAMPKIVHDVSLSADRSLDSAILAFMEPRLDHDFSHMSAYSKYPINVQAKLTVSPPGDIYEQEADRIANDVMAAPSHSAASVAKPHIQRFSGQTNGQMDITSASVDRVLARSGMPLELKLQQDMGRRFGHDFSKVRVHSNSDSEQSAREVNADAYTVGHNIVFGAGKYQPHDGKGQRLLAHELAHVLQQVNGPDMIGPGAHYAARVPGGWLGYVIQRDAALAPETPEILAQKMREAFRGLGTDEDEVYRILSMPPATVQAIYAFYEANLNDHTGRGLIEDIKNEFSGNELGRAMILLSNAGIAVKDFEADTPEQLARKMREAFRGWGTDEDEVYRILSYPPDQVRAMINYYNDNLNDHTGKGLVEDIKDEFSGSELEQAMRLLANAKIELHTVERTTRIQSSVPGEPNKLWAGLIVRGMWSKNHEPGLMEQHADVVIPDAEGRMKTRGYFGDQPGATGSSAGSRASIGMGIAGISADMDWFLDPENKHIASVDLELAKLVDLKSSLILIKVTWAQAADLDRYWEDLKEDPGTFYILGKNCSTAAAAGFEKADLSKEIVGLDTPDNLFQQLRKRYHDAFMISGYYGYTRSGRKWKFVGGEWVLENPGTGSWEGPFVVEKRLDSPPPASEKPIGDFPESVIG